MGAVEKYELANGRVTLFGGDCRDAFRELADASIDSVVTDPPYALVSIQKRFGKPGSAAAKHGADGLYARASAGFMGKQWDTGEVAFAVEFWAEVLRVLKPGGHVVAFSGTRTYHRMAVAIEDAGFEIRDQLAWAYGSGFPKSHDVSKGIDKAAGAKREKVRIKHSSQALMTKDGQNDRPWQEAAKQSGYHELDGPAPATDAARQWQGWGTALKPAWEPICLARKPLIGTVAENVIEHGTGALNIDGCRVPVSEADNRDVGRQITRNIRECDDWGMNGQEVQSGVTVVRADGRWPANIVHDDSQEVTSAFPDGAARFFYSAKADAEDRMGSKHPTVKPVDLMQWLCRMVTPPGGLLLDPFAGSGSTGEAAMREGMRAILCEREPDYQADIKERIRLAGEGPLARRARAAKPTRAAGADLFANDNEPAIGGGRQIYGKFADQEPNYRANRAQAVRRHK
jgi:DNA modification methylase